MELRNLLSDLICARGDEILKYINSLIHSDLRGEIIAEEIRAETVRYMLEHPGKLTTRSANDLFYIFLWKSKMLVVSKIRALRKSRNRSLQEKKAFIMDSAFLDRYQQPSPSLTLHREAKKVSLRHFISILPNKDQSTALRLVRIEGYTAAEASVKMGKSPEAVRKLLQRGFESLVAIMRSPKSWKYATTGETT